MARALALAAAVAALAFAAADTGVDVNTLLPVTAWTCLVQEDFINAEVRVWRADGTADPNGPQNSTLNAWKVFGMDNVDVYMQPCYKCGQPADQVKAMIAYLEENGVQPDEQAPNGFGDLWLQVAHPNTWSTNTTMNRIFIQALIDAGSNPELNIDVGIYTSMADWAAITGNWMGPAQHGNYLWYVNLDNQANMSDFVSFGGWTIDQVDVHQYAKGVSKCGATVNLDYYE